MPLAYIDQEFSCRVTVAMDSIATRVLNIRTPI
jgi:hypothetical protein